MELLKNLASGAKGAVVDTSSLVNGNHVTSAPTKVGLTSPLVDEHPTPLKIVIVGAGIGGLSAALSLRRNGHEVEVSLYIFREIQFCGMCSS